MRRSKRVVKAASEKKHKDWATCNNYLKPCPIALKCANCKNRGFRRSDGSIYCRAGNDEAGDRTKCFICGDESKCKRY